MRPRGVWRWRSTRARRDVPSSRLVGDPAGHDGNRREADMARGRRRGEPSPAPRRWRPTRSLCLEAAFSAALTRSALARVRRAGLPHLQVNVGNILAALGAGTSWFLSTTTGCLQTLHAGATSTRLPADLSGRRPGRRPPDTVWRGLQSSRREGTSGWRGCAYESPFLVSPGAPLGMRADSCAGPGRTWSHCDQQQSTGCRAAYTRSSTPDPPAWRVR